MLVDITLEVTPKMRADAQNNEKKALSGHLGTHFDVMDQVFPLEYTQRQGVVFDVRHVGIERDISETDIDLSLVGRDMFVAFCAGTIENVGYGSRVYFTRHPQLSTALISTLLEKGVSIIGIDFAGVRRGAEHTPTDALCARQGTFVVENLVNLQAVLRGAAHALFTAHTYPMRYAAMSGLPCRVVADIDEAN